MRFSHLGKLAVCGFISMALLLTSFSGSYASVALAADLDAAQPLDFVEKPSTDKLILGGLAAAGLIVALTGHKDKKAANPSDQSTAGVSLAPAPAPANNPAPVSVSIKKTAPNLSQMPSSQIKSAEQQAFDLLNADRKANGLPALRLNGSLVVLAENYGQDMINRNYFSHYNPEGLSPFDRMRNYGINYRSAGENLAINNSVSAAERAFMNSPGHRANILNSSYTEVGVGVSYDSRGSVYVVQEFIGR